MPDNYYSKPMINPPANAQEGLQNFVQMIVNKLERGEVREAKLQAVDLLNDISTGIYQVSMEETNPSDFQVDASGVNTR